MPPRPNIQPRRPALVLPPFSVPHQRLRLRPAPRPLLLHLRLLLSPRHRPWWLKPTKVVTKVAMTRVVMSKVAMTTLVTTKEAMPRVATTKVCCATLWGLRRIARFLLPCFPGGEGYDQQYHEGQYHEGGEGYDQQYQEGQYHEGGEGYDQQYQEGQYYEGDEQYQQGHYQ